MKRRVNFDLVLRLRGSKYLPKLLLFKRVGKSSSISCIKGYKLPATERRRTQDTELSIPGSDRTTTGV